MTPKTDIKRPKISLKMLHINIWIDNVKIAHLSWKVLTKVVYFLLFSLLCKIKNTLNTTKSTITFSKK